MASFQDALNYAKLNPSSDFATQLRKGIQSGQYTDVAKKEGIDISSKVKTQTAPQSPVEQKSVGEGGQVFNNNILPGKALNALTSSTQEAGQQLGNDLTVKSNEKLFEDANKSHIQRVNDLISKYQQEKLSGADSSRTQKLLHNEMNSAPKMEDFISKEQQGYANKTTEQTIGTGLGLGLEVATPLIGGGEAEALTSKELSLGQKAKASSVIGAGYGAGQGLTSSLQAGDSASDVGKNTVIGGTVGAITGGVAAPITELGSKTVGAVTDKLSGIGSKTGTTGAVTEFDKSLNDAQKSIFPKLTPTEKANVKLKDTKGLFGTKSEADLINDPKTKSLLESVANLPEDIKLKPSDSLAVKESKLDQGAARLHQGNEIALNDPLVKANSGFTDAKYNKYMSEKVLDPIKREFGINSQEYKIAQKGIATAKSSFESNDAYGVYTGRQKFSSAFQKENPRAFAKAKGSFGAQLDPKTSATVEANREIYDALNDFNESLLPPNHPLRARMKEESNLIRAKQEMRSRSSVELGKNSFQRSLDRNPNAKKAVNAAGNALKIGAGIHLVP